MMKLPQKVSFNAIMKLWLLLLFCSASNAFAQDKEVEGIVFDKEVKARIARVLVHNITNGQSIYNNLKGEFKIIAANGDALVFSRDGYFADTVKLTEKRTIAVYLKATAIQLQVVNINDTLLSPDKRLAALKRDFTKVYGPLANGDLLSGGGFSIDAIFNAFSRSGQNAERLKGIIERDYQQDVIDYRFSRTVVGNITGLKDTRLTDFMYKYRPGYYFVTTSSDYDFVRWIRSNYRRYMRNPAVFTLQPLEDK